MAADIEAIHEFWFGPLDEGGMCAPDRHKLWFESSPGTDQLCRERFGELVQRAVAGELQRWEASDRGLVALILLLDQFTRNIHRGTPAAFAGDARALDLAQRTIVAGHHQRLPAIHQVFLYMPLEHTENIDIQEECVTLFEELAAVTGNEQIGNFCRYAIAHRDVIERFGRFPHRNAILGRESSPEELGYLQKNGGF
jgi:uncharacterized protein (DUF924 family)